MISTFASNATRKKISSGNISAQDADMPPTDEQIERIAADLWQLENPRQNAFQCDAPTRASYRARVRNGEWLPIAIAPKDPQTPVKLKIDIVSVPAYWEPDLERWVLTRPLHVESIFSPTHWRPM